MFGKFRHATLELLHATLFPALGTFRSFRIIPLLQCGIQGGIKARTGGDICHRKALRKGFTPREGALPQSAIHLDGTRHLVLHGQDRGRLQFDTAAEGVDPGGQGFQGIGQILVGCGRVSTLQRSVFGARVAAIREKDTANQAAEQACDEDEEGLKELIHGWEGKYGPSSCGQTQYNPNRKGRFRLAHPSGNGENAPQDNVLA